MGPWREGEQRGVHFPTLAVLDFLSQWVGHRLACVPTHNHMQIMPSQSMVWLGRARLGLGELPTMWCQLLEMTQAHGQSF